MADGRFKCMRCGKTLLHVSQPAPGLWVPATGSPALETLAGQACVICASCGAGNVFVEVAHAAGVGLKLSHVVEAAPP